MPKSAREDHRPPVQRLSRRIPSRLLSSICVFLPEQSLWRPSRCACARAPQLRTWSNWRGSITAGWSRQRRQVTPRCGLSKCPLPPSPASSFTTAPGRHLSMRSPRNSASLAEGSASCAIGTTSPFPLAAGGRRRPPAIEFGSHRCRAVPLGDGDDLEVHRAPWRRDDDRGRAGHPSTRRAGAATRKSD